MASSREELVAHLRRLPDRIAKIIEGNSAEHLRRAGVGGEWGAVEHLAHLLDFDQVSLERVERILSEDEPEIEEFDTDVRAIELNYHAQDPFATLDKLRAARMRLVDRLAALPDEAWQRTAMHPEFGRITLEELVQRIDAHDAEHVHALKDLVL